MSEYLCSAIFVQCYFCAAVGAVLRSIVQLMCNIFRYFVVKCMFSKHLYTVDQQATVTSSC